LTEDEWRTSTDPARLLRFVQPRTTKRKFRLYLCGGCRQIAHLFYSSASREAVDVAERHAEGLADDDELGRANWFAESPAFGYDFEADFWYRHPEADKTGTVSRLVAMGALAPTALTGWEWQVDEAVRGRLWAASELAYQSTADGPRDAERIADMIAAVEWPGRWLIDCVFGNPFQVPAFDPAWRTSTVVALADAIYADAASDRLPFLADALEDAGCTDADVLAHGRGDGPHVRGCWVVDLVLGRS